MKIFEICAEVLVPKFTRAEVRLPAHFRILADISNYESYNISDRSKNKLRPTDEKLSIV